MVYCALHELVGDGQDSTLGMDMFVGRLTRGKSVGGHGFARRRRGKNFAVGDMG
jgi:hypothetical protein